MRSTHEPAACAGRGTEAALPAGLDAARDAHPLRVVRTFVRLSRAMAAAPDGLDQAASRATAPSRAGASA